MMLGHLGIVVNAVSFRPKWMKKFVLVFLPKQKKLHNFLPQFSIHFVFFS